MSLMKIALIIGGVVIGAGAIGGIAAGVVTSRQAESDELYPTTPSEKPGTKPMEPAGGMISDDPSSNSEETTTLDTVLNSIKKENIVVVDSKDSTDEKQKSDYYAFNLKDENLKVTKAVTIPQKYEVELTINKEKTTFEELNKGVLKVNVTVKEKDQTSNKKEELLAVEGFKAGDAYLIKLLEASGTDSPTTAKEQRLVLNPKMESASMFVSLEQLNKEKSGEAESDDMQSGLTQWINKSTLNTNTGTTLKDVALEGQVKVTKLEKGEKNVTYFTLSSVDKNSYIKLIKTEGKTTKEAVVGEIKTTNLLATSVTVVPTNVDAASTKTILEELSSENNSGKKFETSIKEDSLNRNLSINLPEEPKSASKNSQVFVHAYSVKTVTESAESTDVSFELNVNFGSGKFLTTYKTSAPEQAKQLKDAGFSFYLYTKQLTKAGKDARADDLTTEELKLGVYLKQANYNIPSSKPMMMEKDSNDFKVTGPVAENFSTTFKLKVMKADYMKGIIGFASYTYGSIGETSTQVLCDKVLLTPDLTLINLEGTQQEQ